MLEVVFGPDDKAMELGDWSQAFTTGKAVDFVVNRQRKLTHRAVGGREFDHLEVAKMIRELLDAS